MLKISSVLFLAIWQLTATVIVSTIGQHATPSAVQTISFPASAQGVSVAYKNI